MDIKTSRPNTKKSEFGRNGLIILENNNGDILFADPQRWPYFMPVEIKWDDFMEIPTVGKVFDNHRAARWCRLMERLKEVKIKDRKFFDGLCQYIEPKPRTVRALRKVEKDVFFWCKEHSPESLGNLIPKNE